MFCIVKYILIKNHNFYHIRNILVDTVITLLFEINPELKETVTTSITGF